MTDNRFVFITPAFNAIETIQRCIMSVWFQTYPNWKIIITDDLSMDDTVRVVEQLRKALDLSPDKLELRVNTEKKWEVRNILESLHDCEPEDIICRLDGDDWLCDTDALSIINQRYQELQCDVLWTAHRWSFTNQNISQAMPPSADPYAYPWVSSHLKTFRKKLIDGVPDSNFRGRDGRYFRRIGDQAIYLPVLHQASGNWHFEPIVAYHYTIDMKPGTFQSADAIFQKEEGEFLRNRGFLKE